MMLINRLTALNIPITIAITKNIIPFLVSPAIIWPNPGIMKDNIAAIIGFTILFTSFMRIVYSLMGTVFKHL